MKIFCQKIILIKIPVENYFTTENDVERAVYGAYMALRSGSCMGEGSTMYTEERSDNTGRLDNQSSAGEPFQFTDFSLLPSNTYLKSHWQAMYKTVNNAKFCFKRYSDCDFLVMKKRKIIMKLRPVLCVR